MIRKNIMANFLGKGWGFVSIYLFVPLYLKFLGPESFGLVGFYSTMLAILAFADLGISSTLNREIARLSARDNSTDEMKDLLRTFEIVYCIIVTSISILIWYIAPIITNSWLHFKNLTIPDATLAIRIMGLSLAIQLPSGLYIAGLMGLQMQVRANVIQIAWSSIRSIGMVIVLWKIQASIFAFAVFQLGVNIIYLIFVRRSLWIAIKGFGSNYLPSFNFSLILRSWRFAAEIVLMTIISSILLQADRLTVSRFLSLDMLGYYTIATTIATIPITITNPIASAVLPRFTELLSIGCNEELIRFYHQTCSLVSLLTLPATIVLIVYSKELIMLWTGSTAVGEKTWLIASYLIAGQLMSALTIIPYYIAIAYGNLRISIYLGIASIIVVTPILILLVKQFGMLGASVSWFCLNCALLPISTYLIHKKFLKDQFRQWCIYDVIIPIIVVLCSVLTICQIMPETNSKIALCIQVSVNWVFSLCFCAVSIKSIREKIVVRLPLF